jgi:transposase
VILFSGMHKLRCGTMCRRWRSYAQDLRARVLAAVDGGMAVREAAPLFRVSVSYIYKALIRRRATGDSAASPNRGHRPRKLSPEQEAALAAHIRKEPDITLARLQDWLCDQHGVRLSNGGIWAAVRRLGFTFKKPLSASEQDRPDVVPAGLGGTGPGRSLTPSAWCSSTRPPSTPR